MNIFIRITTPSPFIVSISVYHLVSPRAEIHLAGSSCMNERRIEHHLGLRKKGRESKVLENAVDVKSIEKEREEEEQEGMERTRTQRLLLLPFIFTASSPSPSC